MSSDLAIQVGLFVPNHLVLCRSSGRLLPFQVPNLVWPYVISLHALAAVIIGKLTGLVIGSVSFPLDGSTGNFGVPYLWPLCPCLGNPATPYSPFPIPAITKRPQKIAKQDTDAAP